MLDDKTLEMRIDTFLRRKSFVFPELELRSNADTGKAGGKPFTAKRFRLKMRAHLVH